MSLGTDLLKRLLAGQKARGLNETAMGGELGLTPQAWSNWRTRKAVAKDGFEVALKWLEKNEPKPMEPTRDLDDSGWSDVRGYAQAVGLGSAGAEANEYADVHKLKFKSSSLRGKGLHARSLAVFYGKGDSMREIQNGDAVLFDESDTKPLDGELYVISVGGSYQCKRALILDGAVWFESSNPDGAEAAWKRPRRMDDRRHPITVVGRAWWIGRWLA